MRFSVRRAVVATGLVAGLLGLTPGPASAAGPASAGPAGVASAAGQPPVVLLGTAGLRWSDVGSSTPALEGLRNQGAAGWLAVRSVRSITCPADGWLAVSAGRRAADRAGATKTDCRELPAPTTAGTAAVVPQWADYLAAAKADSFDAHPGLLGRTLSAAGVSSAGVGPGAAIALADDQGRVAEAWPGRVDGASGPVAPSALAGDVGAALKTGPRLLVVDLGAVRDPGRQVSGTPALTGAYTRPRAEQVKSLDTRLGLVLQQLPADAIVIVASIADSGSPSQLQLVAARGPAPLGGSFANALVGSASTRQDGLAQTTDLLPTLLKALGVPVPDDAVGSALAPKRATAPAAARERKLNDLGELSRLVAPIGPWLFNGLVIVQILLYGLATLVFRHSGATGRRWLGRGAVVLASFPAATFLANLVPWWRPAHPYPVLVAAVTGFMIAISALALLGPWRRAVLGPMAVIAFVTAAVLGLDAVLGSHLILGSLMGVQAIVAGRFYGFSNTVFALFASGALLIATALADRALLGDRRRRAVLIVVGVGLLATAIDGTPGIGSDFGGPPALIPAFAVLALLLAGVRVTWRRMLLIAAVTIGVLVALSVLDWLRAPGDRTHLGRFVQSVIDGEEGPVLRRKGAQNLKILYSSYLTLLLPFAGAFVHYVLARPVASGRRPLPAAYDRAPALRSGLIAFLTMAVIAALLNDSGTAVPAYALMVVVPLLIAACVRGLELQDDESEPAPGPSAGLPTNVST